MEKIISYHVPINVCFMLQELIKKHLVFLDKEIILIGIISLMLNLIVTIFNKKTYLKN